MTDNQHKRFEVDCPYCGAMNPVFADLDGGLAEIRCIDPINGCKETFAVRVTVTWETKVYVDPASASLMDVCEAESLKKQAGYAQSWREQRQRRLDSEGSQRVVVIDDQGGDTERQQLLRCTAKTAEDARCSNMQWLSLDELATSVSARNFLCWSHQRQKDARRA